MDLKELIKGYLKTARVMQLATSVNNHPWACTVHFYSDASLNFYWSSMVDRRHSLEIEQNPKVAIAVKIVEDTPDKKYVIGLSAEGVAKLATKEEIEKIGPLYIEKLDKKQKLLDDMLSGTGPFKFYKMIPSKIVLFDVKNFPHDPRQELDL